MIKKNEMLVENIKALEADLTASKNQLRKQVQTNTDLKRKMDIASNESDTFKKQTEKRTQNLSREYDELIQMLVDAKTESTDFNDFKTRNCNLSIEIIELKRQLATAKAVIGRWIERDEITSNEKKALKNQTQSFSSEIDKLKQQLVTAKVEIENLRTERIIKEKSYLEIQIQNLNGEIDESKQLLEIAKAEIRHLHNHNEKINNEKNDFETRTQNFRIEIDELRMLLESSKTKISHLHERIEIANNEKQDFKTRIEILGSQIGILKQLETRTNNEKNALKNETQILSNEIDGLKKLLVIAKEDINCEINDSEIQKESLNNEIDKFKHLMRNVHKQFDELLQLHTMKDNLQTINIVYNSFSTLIQQMYANMPQQKEGNSFSCHDVSKCYMAYFNFNFVLTVVVYK